MLHDSNIKSPKKMPTSPHLQIYKWNLGSITSIMNRFTGVILYICIILLSAYVTFYAYEIDVNKTHESCDCMIMQAFKIIGYIAVFGIIFSAYFHMLNGIRHLLWDVGYGFDLKVAKRNSILILTLSILLTIVTYLITFYFIRF